MINIKAINNFVKQATANGVNPRAFKLIKGDKTLAEFAAQPYSLNDRSQLYSLSKSFTSIGVGIAYDQGLIKPGDKVTDLFADKMPDIINKNLAKMTIRDMLSMSSGQAECVLRHIINSSDSVKTFFEQEVIDPPYTKFVYSTACTYVCAIAVSRVTGMNFLDFLDKYLFQKLDIPRPNWQKSADDNYLGGTGLFLSVEEVAKFGIMLRDKGVYNGQRIVSEDWLDQATRIHSYDIENGSPDWCAGYGYQFWINYRGGYRGDGAYGQLCVVLPEKDMVFTFLGEVTNMQKELDLVFELTEEILKPDQNYDEQKEKSELKRLSNEVYKPALNQIASINKKLKFADNIAQIKQVEFNNAENGMQIVFDCDHGKQIMNLKNGEFVYNKMYFRWLNPSILFLHLNGHLEEIQVFAAYKINQKSITITLRHLNNPHIQQWVFDFENNAFEIHLKVGEINPMIKRVEFIQIKE